MEAESRTSSLTSWKPEHGNALVENLLFQWNRLWEEKFFAQREKDAHQARMHAVTLQFFQGDELELEALVGRAKRLAKFRADPLSDQSRHPVCADAVQRLVGGARRGEKDAPAKVGSGGTGRDAPSKQRGHASKDSAAPLVRPKSLVPRDRRRSSVGSSQDRGQSLPTLLASPERKARRGNVGKVAPQRGSKPLRRSSWHCCAQKAGKEGGAADEALSDLQKHVRRRVPGILQLREQM